MVVAVFQRLKEHECGAYLRWMQNSCMNDYVAGLFVDFVVNMEVVVALALVDDDDDYGGGVEFYNCLVCLESVS